MDEVLAPLLQSVGAMSGFSLTVVFRRSGWQWPLGEGDAVRVYAADGRLAAEVPGTLVRDLLTHAVTGAMLQGQLRPHIKEVPMLPTPPTDTRPRLRLRVPARRRRALLTVVMLLIPMVGCTAYRAAYRDLNARYTALQNPQYRGDANRDLVPYQARNRDGAECARSPEVEAAQAALAADAPKYSSVSAALADPAVLRAVGDPFFACMAARGWRATK